MTPSDQTDLQCRVTNLLATLADDRGDAACNQCSEISRLVGGWILTLHPSHRALIVKGEFFDSSAHDLIVVERPQGFLAIDPTVWQFFPESESMFVAATDDFTAMLVQLTDKYGGTWAVSETLTPNDAAAEHALLETIERNI
jgi:hypothetical protein